MEKPPKYKAINLKEQIFTDYVERKMNVSQLSVAYKVPYSTLRRFIKDELKKKNLEDNFRVEYLNTEDFKYLKIGYTFQYDESFTMWEVIDTTIKESDKVFVLLPTKVRGIKHFVCEEEYVQH